MHIPTFQLLDIFIAFLTTNELYVEYDKVMMYYVYKYWNISFITERLITDVCTQ
jgi:hypothetical protein